MFYENFTDAVVTGYMENKYCDQCRSKYNLRWFGNTSRIVCGNPECFAKQTTEYEEYSKYLESRWEEDE